MRKPSAAFASTISVTGTSQRDVPMTNCPPPPASRASAGTRQKILAPYASDPELNSLLAGMARGDRTGTVFYGEDQPRPTIAQLSIPQGLAPFHLEPFAASLSPVPHDSWRGRLRPPASRPK